MNIRLKILLIISLLSICLTALFYFLFNHVILSNFDKIERNFVKENIARVKSTIESQADGLDTITHDWASWDDTYLFVADLNKEYEEVNIVEDTFTSSAKIDYLLYFNREEDLVHGTFYDAELEEMSPIPQYLIDQLTENKKLFSHSSTESHSKGLILLGGGPVLISARPILTSNGEGPHRGTMIMIRTFDGEKIETIKELTRINFSTHLVNNPPPYADAINPLEILLARPNDFIVEPLDADTIAGYCIIKDIFSNPLLFLRLTFPRDIHIQGHRTLNFLLVLSLGACFIFGLVIFFILDRVILRRLASLKANVLKIGKTAQPRSRVNLAGTDELATLASSINTMLDAIDKTQLDLKEKEVRLRTIAEFTRSGFFITQGSKLIYVNAVMELITGFNREELFNMDWWEIFHKDYRGTLRDKIMAAQKIGTPPEKHEVMLVTKNGEERWLEMRIKYVTAQGKPASFCVCTDL